MLSTTVPNFRNIASKNFKKNNKFSSLSKNRISTTNVFINLKRFYTSGIPIPSDPELVAVIKTPNGKEHKIPSGLFINNKFVKSKDGEKITSLNPATGKPLGSVYAANADDVNDAVKAAKAAFKPWKKTPGTERGQIIYRFAELVEQNFDTILDIETLDSGKPRNGNAEGDLKGFINTFKYYAGWADKIYGQTIDSISTKFAYTKREPLGVCGQIIPWNYPLLMAAWKLAPALATGNTIVLKPSEVTPISILSVLPFFVEAGLPPGVVNVVNGTGKIAGDALVHNPDVSKIAFTGSTATGKSLAAYSAKTLKKVTLELGGKSPAIIFNDADLEQAIKWSYNAIMYNMGQVCCSTSRIYVQSGVYDEFVKKFAEYGKTASIIGDPFDSKTTHGPQVSQAQYEKVLDYIRIGKEDGARLVSGGKPVEGSGYFIEPTIFADTNGKMRIVKEEIFGPVVTIGKFETMEEAVKYSNDTEYGLGSAVFTSNISVAHQVADELEAGMVWINSSNDSDYRIPFGGCKHSGIGRELGYDAIELYTQVKAVHVNLSKKL